MAILLLITSIFLSTLRNVLSKNISSTNFKNKSFYLLQTIIFGTGGIFLAITNISFEKLKVMLLICSFIYGILLILAQYCYTIALKSGKTGICSTVYSLGFIFPTLLGQIFWGEQIGGCDIIGVIVVIVMIVICGLWERDTRAIEDKKYIFPLVIAMLASGALGIVQKIQQNSSFKELHNTFLAISFLFAALISLIFYRMTSNNDKQISKRERLAAFSIGIVFAGANLCNTRLSGLLETVILFPMLNIGVIILSVFAGVIIYKETITKKDIFVLSLGIVSICLFSI